MYNALDSSCFCSICVDEMVLKTEKGRRYTSTMRRRTERDRAAGFDISGIRAFPLDEKLARWQASIVGPPDSPYAGGTFYLYINIPVK